LEREGERERESINGKEYNIRRLEPSDFSKGLLALLAKLTTVGNVSEEDFTRRFGEIVDEEKKRDSQTPPYSIAVIEDNGKIVATGTLFIEKKFIHGCGCVGHIEDVVVHEAMRGHHLGQQIIRFLTDAAKDAHCYKVILDCNEHNVGFYEKCGYSRKSVQMAKYFE
jgi:glucosamine-phosphate N-acetyltransferase